MNEQSPVFIERNDCGACFRCLRECPVKAVRIRDGQAKIVPDACVECGVCVTSCAWGVIRLRDDVARVRNLMRDSEVCVASLSPQWVSEFPGIEAHRMVEALRLLGFARVGESSEGARMLAAAERKYLTEHPGVHVSARCPAVWKYIRKYRPELTSKLMPFLSPARLHALAIRGRWGSEVKVVHISACPASKGEAESRPGYVDAALTFRDLRRWMNQEGIAFDLIPGSGGYRMEPEPAPGPEMLYPLESGFRGEEDGVRFVSCSGLERVSDLLRRFSPDGRWGTVCLDLLACEGGCVGGNGRMERGKSVLEKELLLRTEYDRRKNQGKAVSESEEFPQMTDSAGMRIPPEAERIEAEDLSVSESEMLEALERIGIGSEREELDCDGCGFGTCRRFAKALCRGYAEPSLCFPYVRREAENRFAALLDRIPSGVMLVDDRLRVVDANRNFASMLGAEAETAFDAGSGFRGTDVRELVPFHRLFSDLLENGEESIERDVQLRGKMVHVSVYTVRRNRLAMAVARNLFVSEVRNDEIVKRSQQVIRENMETVRKIAALLGENASRTEAILRSILESQSQEDAR